MNSLQGCVVKSLEGCEDPTPANLLDSIFNYIKKVTPCQKMLTPQAAALTASNSATNNVAYTLALTLVTFVLLY